MPMSGLPPELAQMLSQKGAAGAVPAQPPAQPPIPTTPSPLPMPSQQMPQMSAPLTAGGGPTDFNALAQQMAGPAVAPVKRPNPMAGSGGFLGGFGGGFGGAPGGLLGGMDINALMQMYQQQQAPTPPPPPASVLPPGFGPGMMF